MGKKSSYRRLAHFLWGSWELYGFIVWLGGGTVSNIISFFAIPFIQELPLWAKVLYGISLFVIVLIVSVIIIRILQALFKSDSELALSQHIERSQVQGNVVQANEVHGNINIFPTGSDQIPESSHKAEVEVHPFLNKRGYSDKGENTAWADLTIKNTGIYAIDVGVKILELMQVYEKQKRGKPTGVYYLSETNPKWSPSIVFWSGITGEPKKIICRIGPGDTEHATIGFHQKVGSDTGYFNIRTLPPMTESRIKIELSGLGKTWQAHYYIKYHPPQRDEFEFVEWEEWSKSHKVIEPSTPDKEGFQT